MKILIDMNLSPSWRGILKDGGWEAVHWSAVGAPGASDKAILEYAERHGYVVFTHDLDFSALLSVAQAHAPSVIQVRTQDVLSERFRELVLDALRQFEPELSAGALVVIDESRAKARVLPLK